MIITILSIALLVAGIILLCFEDKYCYISELPFVFGGFFTFIGFIAICCCAFMSLTVQVNKDIGYQNALYQKEMLEYRIDNADQDIVGNELLYNDIVEFNNDLRIVKKWSNNYWTNWFFNEDIATIDYIELDKD